MRAPYVGKTELFRMMIAATLFAGGCSGSEESPSSSASVSGATSGSGGSGGEGGAGGEGGSMNESTRAFHLGFSPWLYDATIEAQDWTYSKIAADGDMISHHLEEGVPWPEAAAGADFHPNYLGEINGRVTRKVSGQKVLLQINPLNISRDGLAPYRGATPNEPLPAPWSAYALNSPEVKAAFVAYAQRMKEYLQPDYLQIGVEVNLLIRNNQPLWSQYLDLHKHTYQALKASYPDLPVGVSVFCVPFFPEYSSGDDKALQEAGLHDLEPYADFVAFSVHPFMSGLLAETFPDDYLDRLFSLTSKPLAVSESSYPAQVWSTSSDPVLTFNGSQEKQASFTERLLEESEEHKALFTIWFAIRDYDALWSGALGKSELALTWRDTGLYDEQGGERQALGVWRSWRTRAHMP